MLPSQLTPSLNPKEVARDAPQENQDADIIQIAAWGGSNGTPWIFKPKGLIKQIRVAYGTVIDSISFSATGVDDGSQLEATPVKLGGSGGDQTAQVNINGSSEYLTRISGTYGIHRNLTMIRSLKFHTNEIVYGPYGSTDGTPFSFVIEQGGKVVGFHGGAGDFLDCIGVFVTYK